MITTIIIITIPRINRFNPNKFKISTIVSILLLEQLYYNINISVSSIDKLDHQKNNS